MVTSPEFLFVYGTLLAEAQHPMGDLLRAHGTEIGSGHIQARLYIIEEIDAEGVNRYPGAVPSAFAEDRVHGRLYRVTDPDVIYPAFNHFEACTPDWPEPYEFELRPIAVTLTSGKTYKAASYLYTWDTSRATPVPAGRYTEVSPDVR